MALQNVTYKQKEEIDNLFNFVASIITKDLDEARKNETVESEVRGQKYIRALLEDDTLYTYGIDNIELRRVFDDICTFYQVDTQGNIISSIKGLDFLRTHLFYYLRIKYYPGLDIPSINPGKQYDTLNNKFPSSSYQNIINYFEIAKDITFDTYKDEIRDKIRESFEKAINKNKYTEEIKNYLNNKCIDYLSTCTDKVSQKKNQADPSPDAEKLTVKDKYNELLNGLVEIKSIHGYFNDIIDGIYNGNKDDYQDIFKIILLGFPNDQETLLNRFSSNINTLAQTFKVKILDELIFNIEKSSDMWYFMDTSSITSELYKDVLDPLDDENNDIINFFIDKYFFTLEKTVYTSLDDITENEFILYERNYIIELMENTDMGELNNYYRILNGKPPLDEDGNEVQYKYVLTNITDKNVIDTFTNATVKRLSYQDKLILIRDNSDIEYLHHIIRPVSIKDLRLANDFYIVQYDETYIGAAKSKKYIDLYYENLKVMLLTYYNTAFERQEMYKPFMRLFLIFITLQSYLSSLLEEFNNIDFFDQERCTQMFKSYNLNYFQDLPLNYQKIILKNINDLIKNAGSDKVLLDIPKLFGLDNTTIFKYYLVKRFDPNNKNAYELAFAKVPVGVSDPMPYLLNEDNYLNYNEVIREDPYWNKTQEEILKSLNDEGISRTDHYNYRTTKYISILSSVNMLEQTQNINYILHLIQSVEARVIKARNEKNNSDEYNYSGSSLRFINTTYKPTDDSRISILDGFIMINWLILMRGKINSVELGNKTYGAYFAKALKDLTNKYSTKTINLYNILDTYIRDDYTYYKDDGSRDYSITNLDNNTPSYRFTYEFYNDEERYTNFIVTDLYYEHKSKLSGKSKYELLVLNLLSAIRIFYNQKYMVDSSGKLVERPPEKQTARSLAIFCQEYNIGIYKEEDNGESHIIFNEPFKDKELIITSIFETYINSEEFRETVDLILRYYIYYLEENNYILNGNQRLLKQNDFDSISYFTEVYKKFKNFREYFERIMNTCTDGASYVCLKQIYSACMTSSYQEECFGIISEDSNDLDRERNLLSDYAFYLQEKDDVFFTVVSQKINELLPTEDGAVDNPTYLKTYIDGINDIILDLLDSIEGYMNDHVFEDLFHLSDTNTLDTIRFYLKQVIQVFKSYTLHIRDVRIDYTLDNDVTESIRLFQDLYRITNHPLFFDCINRTDGLVYEEDELGNLVLNKKWSRLTGAYDHIIIHNNIDYDNINDKDTSVTLADNFTYNIIPKNYGSYIYRRNSTTVSEDNVNSDTEMNIISEIKVLPLNKVDYRFFNVKMYYTKDGNESSSLLNKVNVPISSTIKLMNTIANSGKITLVFFKNKYDKTPLIELEMKRLNQVKFSKNSSITVSGKLLLPE